MISRIEKSFVKKSFNLSARTYDDYSEIQKNMTIRLMQLLPSRTDTPITVLDIGMGTGNLTLKLHDRFPEAQIHGCDLAINMINQAKTRLPSSFQKQFLITADAEFLPYMDNSFDIVTSSFTYQWLSNWDMALKEVWRILNPGGVFVFSAFGQNTFTELKSAYKKACTCNGYKQGEALELSVTEKKTKHSMSISGLKKPFTESHLIVKNYQSVKELLRSIKGMGAKNAAPNRNKSLGTRKIWNKMVESYEQDFAINNSLPATFEIIIGGAEKIP